MKTRVACLVMLALVLTLGSPSALAGRGDAIGSTARARGTINKILSSYANRRSEYGTSAFSGHRDGEPVVSKRYAVIRRAGILGKLGIGNPTSAKQIVKGLAQGKKYTVVLKTHKIRVGSMSNYTSDEYVGKQSDTVESHVSVGNLRELRTQWKEVIKPFLQKEVSPSPKD